MTWALKPEAASRLQPPACVSNPLAPRPRELLLLCLALALALLTSLFADSTSRGLATSPHAN